MEKIMNVVKSKKEVIIKGAILVGGAVIGGLISTIANKEDEYEPEIFESDFEDTTEEVPEDPEEE